MSIFESHPLYRKHDLDSLMSSSWQFYKSNFISLFIISLVLSLLMQYLATMIDMKDIQSTTDPAVMLEKLREAAGPIAIIMLVSLFTTTFLQHYIIYKPVDPDNTFIQSFLKSFRYYIPFLILMILFAVAGSVALVIGVLALIIGVFFVGLYLIMIYLFILPVMMMEGTNIGHTISRTFTLAHRNFWSNMGWVAVFLIIMIVISVIMSGIILLPFTGSFLKSIVNPDSGATFDYMTNPVYIALSAVVSALTLPLMPILGSALYFNGRAGEQEIMPVPDEKVKVEDLYARPRNEDKPWDVDK